MQGIGLEEEVTVLEKYLSFVALTYQACGTTGFLNVLFELFESNLLGCVN